jgi:hypothetical protein
MHVLLVLLKPWVGYFQSAGAAAGHRFHLWLLGAAFSTDPLLRSKFGLSGAVASSKP